ncbi:hypothetical protein [Pollutimonas harenae]|uniref:DoxX family protein n=1 Tax=Pollutimonas harenae TaxID=657015 RepID=A0A853GYL7_9BURK|nr:hypothetical protein [Pollutimonas harenae]NYT85202.1 hypothetical protein [Pollutimonas harenae]TEA72424.1 hypothetical protein ERD84_00460 [Pollutimonas harenae]
MQLVAIVLLMVVMPIISIVHDVANNQAALVYALGKWFVFWGVGWRLVSAAAHQMMRPAYTAKDIFEIDDPAAGKLVLEIGFGNLAIGIPAIASLYFPAWVPALALAGCIFFALAGFQHIRNKATTRAEVAAMVSDLGLAAVLAVYLLWLGLSG